MDTSVTSFAQFGLTEEQVQEWATQFNALHARIAPRFARAEPRRQAWAYLCGLLSALERKNGWHLAAAAGDLTPDRMQRLLNAADWDAAAVRDDLRAYVVEHLGDATAVLVVDETGFLKKGTKSVGVKRQYSGTAGRIENCQIGVFLAYAAPEGHCFIDRELYLPQEWTADTQRREEAGVPKDQEFATKPQLARQMLERAFKAGVPRAWVTGDEVYGGDRRLRLWLEEQEQPFVLAVACDEPLWCNCGRGVRQERADTIAVSVAADSWQRLSAGAGAKGPRLYDWVRVRLSRLQEPPWDHWLLIRRSIAKPEELAYYVVFGPATSTLPDLVSVAGRRWTVEECIEQAKGEVGLDQYEVRHWTSWYRHITLALLAQAYLAVMRKYAAPADREKGGP
jgi:SRSO17 transposase